MEEEAAAASPSHSPAPSPELDELDGEESQADHDGPFGGEDEFDGEEPAWAGTTWGAGIDFCALKLTSVALSYHVSCFTQC